LSQARVIDLYAGTGALGLEALSRGGSFATFVESDRRALEALTRNVEALRERPRTRILPFAATRAITVLAGDAASLVFCDPPYAHVAGKDGAVQLLASLTKDNVARAGATIVLEHATRDKGAVEGVPTAVPALREIESRAYGDTTLTFFLVESAAP